MLVHAKSRLARDITNHLPEAGVVDLVGPATSRADDVMVVDGIAADVCVLAGRQVEALDRSETLEDLERPEDRRAADAETPRLCLGDELGCREVACLVGDDRGKGPSWLGQAVAGAVER